MTIESDERDERNKQKESEPLFQQSLTDMKSETYLGNTEMIEAILLTGLQRIIAVVNRKGTEPADYQAALKRECEYAGRIFLGKNKNFTPLSGWNEEGMIDEFIAKWTGSSEIDPLQRMTHGVLRFFNEMIELANTAGEPGILDEQVQWQTKAIVDKYKKLLVGMDPATEMTLEG